MSMYESADKINQDLQQLFSTDNINNFTEVQKAQILNIIIRFGAVAKFRCRSNVAYRNFVEASFKDISEIGEKMQGDYKVIVAIPKEESE